MNNVGALAVFLPAALEVSRRHGTPASAVLMPMAFASLLGGLITLIGTPPNILISAVRRDTVGEPFSMFDFAPIGLPLTLAGLALLTVIWRLLPSTGRGAAADEPFRIDDYLSEVTLPDTSSMVGRTVGELESQTEGTFRVLALQRPNGRRAVPTRAWVLRGGDRLQLETEPRALEQAVAEYGLELAGSKELPLAPGERAEIGVLEAIVGGESPLVGRTPAELGLRERYGVNLLAVSRRGSRPVTQLKGFLFQTGDVLMLQGASERMREQLRASARYRSRVAICGSVRGAWSGCRWSPWWRLSRRRASTCCRPRSPSWQRWRRCCWAAPSASTRPTSP
ncbi:MAG: SLC13 family permease [Geminicoccaceae bacterium]